MCGIRELAEKSNKTSSRLFYLKGADPENIHKQRRKEPCHDIAYAYVPPHLCKNTSMHTHLHAFWRHFFFLFLFFFPTSIETVLNNGLVQVEWFQHPGDALQTHPVCCPTAESSYSFKPKQGVAIPLPACPLLSSNRSVVEEQGFKWTGGAIGKVTQYTLLCNHLPLKLQQCGEISQHR